MYLNEIIHELEIIHASTWFLFGIVIGMIVAMIIIGATGGMKK